jgi:hypothetical protein
LSSDAQQLSELEAADRLQDILVSVATGDTGSEQGYQALRKRFRSQPETDIRLPEFVRRCRDLNQFWSFIKGSVSGYQPRREYLWSAFGPLIEFLELKEIQGSALAESGAISSFNSEAVRYAWKRALDRRFEDPEGAITAARTLVETVCKHVLDDRNEPYSDNEDLPTLWHKTAKLLQLAPSKHEEQPFKTILGNCASVVSGLANLRNTFGDAHGKGRKPVKPGLRHAELAVNLAGTMAAFLIATYEARQTAQASDEAGGDAR